MASRIQKKNRTKKSPRNLAGAVLSLPALKYGDSRTFFIENLCDDNGMDCVVIDVPNHYVKNSIVEYEKIITQPVSPKYIVKIYNVW